jgi:hypothetical protein
MAWFSFWTIIAIAAFMIGGAALGGAHFAAGFSPISGILETIVIVLAGIVGAYLGVSLTEAIKRPL